MPSGIFGQLPPGLRGYVAAEQNAQARGINELQKMQGILGLQNQMQMQPLQFQLLQQQLAKMRAIEKLREQAMGGGAPGMPTTPQQALAQGGTAGDVGPTLTNAARIGQVPQSAPGGAGIDPQLRAMLMSGDPGLIAAAQAQLKRQEPIIGREAAPILERQSDGSLKVVFSAAKTEPGVQVNYGPGGTMSAGEIPAYGDVVSRLAGRTTAAQEEEKARRDLVTVPGVGEQPPTYRSRAELLPPRGPAVPQAMPSPRLAAIRPAPAIPPGPAVPLAPSARPVAGPSPQQAAAQAAAQAGGVETARGRAQTGVDYEKMILEAGGKAQGTLTTLQILLPNLEQLPTGPLYPTMLKAGALFSQMGIDVGEMGKQLGPAQASQAILNQFALKLRNPSGGEGMPGQLSDQDRKFLVDSIPGLHRVPDGNRQLFKIMLGLEQRKVDSATIVSRMQADGRNSADIRAAITQFANTRPLFPRR